MTQTIYIPVAYQDDLSGRKLILQMKDSGDYLLLLPPEYDPARALRGVWVLEAALGRDDFQLFESPQEEIRDLNVLRPSSP